MASPIRFPALHRWLGAIPAPPVPALPSEPAPRWPEGVRPVRSPQDLLFARRERVNRIEELAGTTPAHFERYYLAALHRYAAFVQEFPASEAHHHAHAGGLLDHALEVAVTALKLRRGYLLPPGALPEQAVHRQDLWTYAVFTGALIHDLGKPAVDMIVTVFDARGRSWRWNPWAGALGDEPAGRGYRVAFARGRKHRLHEQAAPLLALRLLGAEGLAWLAQDLDVFAPWLAFAQGETLRAGVLGEMLGLADGRSVAANLGAEPGPRAAVSAVVPLPEKLATALRHLIDTGELPLNRNGAAGWRVGESLWMVSKRAVDALRLHLTQTGHTGVPARNDRLFDVLQDHGILVPAPKGRAVWRCAVRGDGWAHELTLLQFPVVRIWPDHEGPAAFAGTVEPTTQAAEAEAAPQGAAPEPAEESAPAGPVPAPSAAPTRELSAGPAEPSAEETTAPPAADPGKDFWAWLVEGLAARDIDYNQPGARVHVVPEGVLLVSPGLFQDYAEQANRRLAAGGEPLTWEKAQKRFLKLGLHQRTATGLNVHRYAVAGDRRKTRINGVLLTDPARVFGAWRPSPNPHLRRE